MTSHRIFDLTNDELKNNNLPHLLIPGATMERSKDTEDQTQNVDYKGAGDTDYFRKTGRISFISDDYGLIDDNLYFFNRVAQRGKNLSVGDTVTYLSYRDKGKGNPEKIISVSEYVDLNSLATVWRENCLEVRSIHRASLKLVNALIAKSTERVVNGRVSKKIGKRIFIFPLNVHCDLDKVQCDFIPIEGDWLSVKTEFVDNPFGAGQICQVVKLEPVLIRYGVGAVTLAKENGEGIIENEIFFTANVSPTDFKPVLGYPVKYTAIESTQGRYRWRALSIQNPPARGEDLSGKKTVTRFKNGIMIKGRFQFGPMNLDDTEELVLDIKNHGRSERTLSHCSFTSAYCSSQLELREPKNSTNLVLKPGQYKKFIFTCKARFLGISTEIFEFYFKGFKMEYLFTVNVSLTNEIKALLPEENKKILHPKKNTYLYKNFDYSDAFYGMKVAPRTRYSTGNSVNKQSSYILPEDLFKIILGDPEFCKTKNHSHIVETVLRHYPSLDSELNIDNYRERFHTLLYFEEIEDRIMYRKFDLHNVILRKKDNFLALGIPRIVEDKIVLGIGTQVILTQPWSETNTGKQVGYIHEYRDHEIVISFHESFERTYDGSECDIMFQPSRTTYIRSHTAVDVAVSNLGPSWLFPTELVESPPVLTFEDDNTDDANQDTPWGELGTLSMNDFDCCIDDDGFVHSPASGASSTVKRKDNAWGIRWFNKDLNVQQKAAVKNILEGKGRTIPYIIQGPPGTGKTVTVIELVLQMYTLISDSRIIIATPSNSAADLVCQKLIEAGDFSPGQVVRLLSFGRLMAGNFPEEIGPFCTSTQEDIQMVQPKGCQKSRFLNINEFLGSERIVIGTCCTLAILHDYGLKPGHFTHIIIDEAAQSTEPESLIPMNFLDGKRGQVILTGDTEQLGPISINFLSVRFGFSKSLMERINQAGPYLRDKEKYPKTDGFDPRCVTRLKYNYRSVPDILRLPNQLFYDSELIPTLSDNVGKMADIIRKFNEKVGILRNSSAMLFHGLCSVNFQEENNFSWYNPHELWQTVRYLKKLYALDLTPDDIGVITPYQKQVEKMRYILNGLRIPMPKIGSVEEFQGQERLVIILSTVRSDIKRIGTKESLIGFLSSPRRLNVAITRARGLLIIIGNPYTLAIDRYWLEVIRYCVRNSFYIGCPLEELFSEPVSSE